MNSPEQTDTAVLMESLALRGGSPVRTTPLPLEFPGAYFYGEEEFAMVGSVVRARSPFRYYGHDLQGMVDKFEREFADFTRAPYVLGVNSGTSALTISLMAMGVGPGTEVIVPGYLWVSTVAAVVRLGAIPVLADIDDTFCLNPADVQNKLTERTKAVVAVHMSGASGNIRDLAELCSRSGVLLLEDVAQSVGAGVDGRMLGTFGDMSIFSFQLNKPMTSGEGGAICTSSKALYNRAFAAHDLGYARNDAGRLDFNDLETATWGCGSRMSEVTAALLRAQLTKLPRICSAMRGRKAKLTRMLADIPGISFRRVDDPTGEIGSFLLISLPEAGAAQFYVEALRAEGIVPDSRGINTVRMTDWGLHIYYNIPALVHKIGVSGGNNPWEDPRNNASNVSYEKGSLPVCDDLVARTILMAIPPVLTEEDLRDISKAWHKVAAAQPLPQGK